MAESYFEATGVLRLKQVTPVIKALFKPYELDATYPGNDEFYIATVPEQTNDSWNAVRENLAALVAEMGLHLPEDAEETMEEYLCLLASHFGVDGDTDLMSLIWNVDFDGTADLGALVDLARCFDDGHGLRAVKWEGCWRSSKPRLFHAGGYGEYYGQTLFHSASSTDALELGESLDMALVGKDQTKAADLLVRHIGRILAGVTNGEVRDSLRKQAGALLLAEAGVEVSKVFSFVKQVANLKKWGEPDPDNDGEPFEPSDGVDDSHSCLMDLIDQARETLQAGDGKQGIQQGTDKEAGYDRAELFMLELLDAVETLDGVADQYGSQTLADLMYLHSAILSGGFIDHYPGESNVLEIASGLPSGEQWVKFVKVEYLLQADSRSGGVKSISDDDVCARCSHCGFRPDALSDCKLNWPGQQDEDGYFKTCPQFEHATF